MIERTKEALAAKIVAWEHSAGESFTDYYMHDHVKNVSWAFWLLGKGFSVRANILIDLIQAGNTYIDQELLYNVHDHMQAYADEPEAAHMDNVLLWAEFLVASDRYWKDITKWFMDN